MAKLFKEPASNKDSGVLVKLWRKVVDDKNLYNKIPYLVDRYVKRTNPMSTRVNSVKNKTKSTVTKNISDTDMTIKTFLDLIFNLLGTKKLTISIKITHPNGEESIHSLHMDDGDLNEKDFKDVETTDRTSSKTNSK